MKERKIEMNTEERKEERWGQRKKTYTHIKREESLPLITTNYGCRRLKRIRRRAGLLILVGCLCL